MLIIQRIKFYIISTLLSLKHILAQFWFSKHFISILGQEQMGEDRVLWAPSGQWAKHSNKCTLDHMIAPQLQKKQKIICWNRILKSLWYLSIAISISAISFNGVWNEQSVFN